MRRRCAIYLFFLVFCTSLSCTRYEFLTEEVYEQASYSNKVDVLFIVDNSGSMEQEQAALGENFDRFIRNLNSAAQEEARLPHETLYHAVYNYLFYLNNQSGFINFHLGMTTTDMSEGGERGALIDPYPDDGAAPPYISADDPDVVTAFNDALEEVRANPTIVGEEQGLAAMRRAVCLSLPDPSLYDESSRTDLVVGCSDVGIEDVGLNDGFLRDGVALAVVVVTDEGDSSEARVEDYLTFLDDVGKHYSFSAIAPTLPEDENDPLPSCNPEGSLNASLQRYREAAYLTGGLLLPICNDFAQILDDLGSLINNLLIRFELRHVPLPESILVFVDGVEVPQSETNGWVFNPAQNTIEFTGTAVPDFDARIEVYYRTVTSTDPRTLPF